MSSPYGNSCVKASEVLEVSHDKVTRFLNQSNYTGSDLFKKAAPNLILSGGTISVDDTVIDKPYSKPSANELVSTYWSGKHHRVVKGISLISLVYTDKKGCCLPINFRLYDPNQDYTKHELFQQMLRQVIGWGLCPAWVTADSWYASIANLKLLRGLEISFMIGVKSDRVVSSTPGVYEKVGQMEQIPTDGIVTHLRKFGFVKLFRTVHPDDRARHYIIYKANDEELITFKREQFKELKRIHWNIEQMHRVLKQVCSLERFFVRKAQAVKTHVFAALRAFQRITLWHQDELFPSVYDIRKVIFIQAQRKFIKTMTA